MKFIMLSGEEVLKLVEEYLQGNLRLEPGEYVSYVVNDYNEKDFQARIERR